MRSGGVILGNTKKYGAQNIGGRRALGGKGEGKTAGSLIFSKEAVPAAAREHTSGWVYPAGTEQAAKCPARRLVIHFGGSYDGGWRM